MAGFGIAEHDTVWKGYLGVSLEGCGWGEGEKRSVLSVV
jgi:hypothetical protein